MIFSNLQHFYARLPVCCPENITSMVASNVKLV